MRWLLALCGLIPCILGAEDDWQAVLHRIGKNVSDAVIRSDNYICVQDLSRFYYVTSSPEAACQQPPKVPATRMRVEDRLKLDVAVSQGAEIYSWHGERHFSASSVSEVVREGPISSGSFNGYLRNIFGERGIGFSYRGRAKLGGIEVFQFDYRVPIAASHYEIQAGKGFEVAPFHGSFSAKADTFEIQSLTVTAEGDKVSAKTNICAAETRLTYQLVKIAEHESLLAASFDLLVGSRNGAFTESKGVYSLCREYRGESTVKFDGDDSSDSSVQAEQLQSKPLAAGLIFPIALRTEIDEDTAYAGLPVEAVLQRDLKVGKELKIARGARLRGTLTEFEIIHEPSHTVSLRLEFESIADGNKLYLCRAKHHPESSTFLPAYAGGRGRRTGPFSPVQSRLGNDPLDDRLSFEGRHLHLKKNYTSEFITVSASQ